MLGFVSTVILGVCAVLAGLGHFSIWWAVIPALVSASFSLANGPDYDRIMLANREGRLWYFPVSLAQATSKRMALAAILCLFVTWFS